MNDFGWLVALGLVAQVVGFAIAIHGVAASKKELFPNRPLPAARLGRWLKRKVRPRRGETITATVAMGDSAHSGGSLFPLVVPGRPSDDEPFGEHWIWYLTMRLDNIDEQRTFDERTNSERHRTLHDEVAADRIRVNERLSKLDGRIATAVGGEDGRGLDLTWFGLGVSLIGAVVQVVAIVLAS